MNFLSIDSGTPHLVVSVGNEEEFLVGNFSDARKTHSNHIIQSIEEVLAEAKLTIDDIDYFAASEGPGSFTGLRIGMATMQGFAFANEKKVLKVNTLDAFAYGRRKEDAITIAMLDARNRRVYAAAFLGDETVIEARVGSLDEFVQDLGKVINEKSLEFSEYIFVGDHTREVYAEDDFVLETLPEAKINVAPAFYEPETLHQLVLAEFEADRIIEPNELVPNYYAKTQAERELEK